MNHTRLCRLGAVAALGTALSVAACQAPLQAQRLVPPRPERPSAEVQIVPPMAHNRGISALAVFPDSPFLVTASEDWTLIVWHLQSGRSLRRLLGHQGPVTAVVFHPDGRRVASGSLDGTVRLWDLQNGHEVLQLRVNPPWSPEAKDRKHGSDVHSLAFSPDGRSLLVGTAVGLYQLEVDSGRQVREFARGGILKIRVEIPAVHVSAHGHVAAATRRGVYLWKLDSDEAPRLFEGHTGGVLSVVFSPDGARIASAGVDGAVIVRSVGSGDVVAEFRDRKDPVRSLAFSSDGRLLASGSNEGETRVWDVDGRDELHRRQRLAGGVGAVAFVPRTSNVIAGAWAYAVAWSTSTGQAVQLYYYEAIHQLPNTLCLSPDGSHVLSATLGGGLVIWDLRSGRQVRHLSGSRGTVMVTAFGRRGHVASGTLEGNVDVWDFRTGKKLFELPKHRGSVTGVEFSSDGSRLLTSDQDGVRLWRLDDRAIDPVVAWPGGLLSGGVQAFAYTPDERKIAIATWDPAFRAVVRDFASGEVVRLGGAVAKALDGLGHALGGANPSPTTLRILGDGSRILSGARDGVMRLWNANTGEEIRSFSHDAPVKSVAFSPDAESALAVSGPRLWLWDLATGRQLWRAEGHTAPVLGAVFTLDGRHVISASEDGTWRIWESGKGRLLLTYVLTSKGDWLAFTPDGFFDGTPGAWSDLQWRFSEDTLDTARIEIFFNDFFYPNLLDDVLAGKARAAPSNVAQIDRRQPIVELTSVRRLLARLGERPMVRVTIRVSQPPPDQRHPGRSGARDLRLFRNGTLVKVWEGELLRDAKSHDFETQMPLVAGDNHFSAYAFNGAQIKSADATGTIRADNLPQQPARAYVVAIGTNSYRHGWPTLSFARKDAQDFSLTLQKHLRALKTRGGSAPEPVPVELLDEQATYDNIVNLFRRLGGDRDAPLPNNLSHIQPAQPEDLILVFFSGHGTARRDRFYFLPHDAQPGTEPKQAISDLDLQRLTQGIMGKEFLVIIDSCNSGSALGSEDQRVGPMNSKGLAQLAWEKGMMILAASQSYESASESGRHGHGLLTHALVVEGLDEAKADTDPHDDEILVGEWFDYAVKRVPELHAEGVRERYAIGLQRSRLLGADPLTDAEREQLEKSRDATQQPRVFYRRQPPTDPLVVRRVSSGR